MDKSILMQKQIKDNAEDLQKEFLDMKNWEEQMKHKDEEIRKEGSDQVTLPPIRNKHKNRIKNDSTKKNEIDNKPKRIKAYDYSTWDKFDADEACKEIDTKEQSDSEGESMSKEELEKAHKEATKHRNEGNIFVQQQKWVKAVGCYNEAIKLFPFDAVFYANRALCQLKLDNLYSAESDCTAAIQLDDVYVKAYYRRATARMNLKQYKEAKQDIEKVLELEPSNKGAKLLLNKIESKIICPKTSNIVKEHAKQSFKKLSIEQKIGEKIWNSTTSNVQEMDTNNIKDITHTEENIDIRNITNIKNSTEVKENNVTDTAVEKKRDPRIPDWLPEKDDVIVIEPIEKPPHLRSKQSLTKIPIQEVDFDINYCDYVDDKTETICSNNEPIQTEETHKDSNVMKNDSSISVPESSKVINIISPIPKTAVQFVTNWKTNNSSEFRYKYLKQLPEDTLPKIFQDSMESDIFSQIIEVLRIEFIKRKDPIYYYLKDLSQVKRFRALIMFINSSDKESLRVLFEYCKTVENVPQDKILVLRDKYEI
ncbi:RNA polymerase II-associated protein 3 [Eufriesea mexicana]|uniref:RNA polymerase II-associated protein 3 n=1 Tax=Eufriesea mexicana TaxID=516756 RepID=A0A310SMJ7_9HYME|nr:PREDICTED: RNA polymerase II-associated protein 3 [Eufriesea mexicana]OAD58122.1 RNA polymerase II-associated protein 3 [Eufriesea mexicana]